MRRQALKIHEWQDNVYVKIPITNTSGQSSVPLIERLAGDGVKLNITAMLTPRQVTAVVAVLNPNVPSIVSVFAGRIADTGVDPSPIMKESLEIVRALPNAELLWASVREVLNVFQAAACGCHIVTVPHDILKNSANSAAKTLLRALARYGSDVPPGCGLCRLQNLAGNTHSTRKRTSNYARNTSLIGAMGRPSTKEIDDARGLGGDRTLTRCGARLLLFNQPDAEGSGLHPRDRLGISAR